MDNNGIELVSVEDHLPPNNCYVLIFHGEGNQMDGYIGFYIAPNWFKLDDSDVTDENIELQFKDITDWVDYWAMIPKIMFADDITYLDYIKTYSGGAKWKS